MGQHTEANRHLMAAMYLIVPEESQTAVVNAINRIRWELADSQVDKEVTKTLLSVMSDGVWHGNWPTHEQKMRSRSK